MFGCELGDWPGYLAGSRHLLSMYRKLSPARFAYTAAMPNNYLVTAKFRIHTVCTVAYFQDTEGNVAAISELDKA